MASNALDGGMLVPEPSMVQMFPSGTYVDLLEPKADAIHAEDIAHHTGMTVRYGGGVRRFYSVAEHACLVGDLLAHQGHDHDIVMAGYLHDAAEAYAGDVVSPLKFSLRLLEAKLRGLGEAFEGDNGQWFTKPPRDLRGIYSEVSDGIDVAIGERFGIDADLFDHPAVKLADMWALKIEAAALTYGRGEGWRWPGELPEGGALPATVSWEGGLNPESARARWLRRMALPLQSRVAAIIEEDAEVLDRLGRGEWAPEDDEPTPGPVAEGLRRLFADDFDGGYR